MIYCTKEVFIHMNTFDILKKHYNVEVETEKLMQLFFKVKMFQETAMFSVVREFTFSEVFNSFYLRKWEFRRTFLTIEEMIESAGIPLDGKKKLSNDQLLSFLEIMKNVVSTQFDFSYLTRYSIVLNKDIYVFMIEVLNDLIDNMELTEQKDIEGWINLVPKNETLERVVEDYKMPLQWEIISYLKIKKDDINAKRKQLAYLATELNIEKNKDENQYMPYTTTMDECCFILNNLQIRHNKEIGKWESEVVKEMDKQEMLNYCDFLYDKMLIIVLMRKHLTEQIKLKELRSKLKDEIKKSKRK